MLHTVIRSRRLYRSMALGLALLAGLWECGALMRSRLSGWDAHR
ncbi:hypothetical protein [uncultured Aquabacterium sp.]|jgi:hypothetical protein|nr:hypothetical protein [uncultured Aquabacterium sp.]